MDHDLQPEPEPAAGPLDYPPPPMPRPEGRTWTVVGFVLAAAAVIIFPIFLGPAATACGVVGLRKGDQLGKWAAIAGVAGTVVGVLLAAALVDEGADEALALLLLHR